MLPVLASKQSLSRGMHTHNYLQQLRMCCRRSFCSDAGGLYRTKEKKTAQPSAILLLDLGQKHVTAGARVVTSWSAFGSHWAMKHVRMKNYKETGRGEDHRTCPRLGVVQIRYRLFRDRTRRTLRRFGIDFVGISTPVSERFMALLMRVG